MAKAKAPTIETTLAGNSDRWGAWDSGLVTLATLVFLVLGALGLGWGTPTPERTARYPENLDWNQREEQAPGSTTSGPMGLYQTAPYQSYHADETIILDFLSTMDPGELDLAPPHFYYPTFWIYSTGAVLFLADQLGWVELRPTKSFYLENPGAMAEIYRVGRFAAVLAAALAIPLLYTTAWLWFGRSVAAWSALFLTATPLWVRNAHFMAVTQPSATLMVATVLVVTMAIRSRSRRLLWLAAFVAGLATSTKYPAGAIFGLVLFAAWRFQPWSWRLFGQLQAFLLVGFALGSPYWLLSPGAALEDLQQITKLNLVSDPDRSLIAQWVVSQGTLPAVLALLGTGAMLWRWRDVRHQLVLVWLLAGSTYWMLSQIDAVRLLLPAMPPLALAAGWATDRLWRARRPWRLPARGLATVALLAGLGYSVEIVVLLAGEDVRDEAGLWIDREIAAGSRIAIFQNMYSDVPIIDSDRFDLVTLIDSGLQPGYDVVVLSSENQIQMRRWGYSLDRLGDYRRTRFTRRPMGLWTWPVRHRPRDWLFTFLDVDVFERRRVALRLSADHTEPDHPEAGS